MGPEDQETIASAGWSTLACYASVNDDAMLDTLLYSNLLDTIQKEILSAQNRGRYTMNGFIIAMGTYVTALTEKSKEVAKAIGKISVDVCGTACKVPLAGIKAQEPSLLFFYQFLYMFFLCGGHRFLIACVSADK